MHPLVSGEELARLLEAGEVLAADVRWYLDGRSGRGAYEIGHIPGAVFIDLDGSLAAPPGAGPGRHPLPSPSAFGAAMSAAGIGDDDVVAAYDDAGGSVAARLWWMLRATGHVAAVLDGGLAGWQGDLEAGAGQSRPPKSFTATAWPDDAIVDAATVARLLQAGAPVLDARAVERYRGEVEPVDPRAGHIPGARSAPWSTHLDPASGRFRSPDELRASFVDLGVRDNAPVVSYCGSGVTACHGILALEVAGFPRARLYEGSWSDWCSDPTRALATGDAAR